MSMLEGYETMVAFVELRLGCVREIGYTSHFGVR
jgi:hypothetical protein